MIILNKNNFGGFFKKYVGLNVQYFYLIQYLTPDGQIENDDIQLEFIFNNKNVLRISSAPDGEQVSIYTEPWADPFKCPINNDNEKFIKEHGKWCLIDVSTQQPFSSIIGKSVVSVEGIQDQFGVLAGLMFTFGDKVICYCIDGDEGQLFWGKDHFHMRALGFQPLQTKDLKGNNK